MWRPRKPNLGLTQRLLLLTIVPLVGLIAAGVMSLQTLYSSFQSYAADTRTLAAFRAEVSEFGSFAAQLAAERRAALDFGAHRGDASKLQAFRARMAETDVAVAGLLGRLDRLVASPRGAWFAEKGQAVREAFATQLPDARTSALEAKKSNGDVFQLYMKLAYSALFITECYRPAFATPPALNIFDGVLALQKIQTQETVATDLVQHGFANGGLEQDELALLRRQFFVSTENEYYLLKFQPEVRGYFKAEARKTADDTAFYSYLGTLAGTQAEKTSLPPFVPKAVTLAELLANHFAAFDRVYDFAFTAGEKNLLGVAAGLKRHAAWLGGGLVLVIVLSLAFTLAITRGTRRQLLTLVASIERASEDVKAAAQQLVASGQQMSGDASACAEGSDRIGTSVTQVCALAETNTRHAANANAISTRARGAVDSGLGTIRELDAAMSSARGSGEKIHSVISRINDLSFQTNILALNAAVEAARAGSAGAGFAVVADEVRRLAQRCAEAAQESAQLIGASAQDTATAIAKSDELAARFKTVSGNIHEVSEIVTLLSTNFIQQADSIREINTAVSQQRGIAQSMAAAAEETAATALSMDSQVETLETSVSRMDRLLGARKNRDAAEDSARCDADARPREAVEAPVEDRAISLATASD